MSDTRLRFFSESQSAESANHAVPEDSRLSQLEERALVEAIRDTFLPGLSLSDTVIFATLIVDVFQGAEAETIFQNGNQEQTSVSKEPEQVSTKPVAELSVPSSYEAGNSHTSIFSSRKLETFLVNSVVLNSEVKKTEPGQMILLVNRSCSYRTIPSPTT